MNTTTRTYMLQQDLIEGKETLNIIYLGAPPKAYKIFPILVLPSDLSWFQKHLSSYVGCKGTASGKHCYVIQGLVANVKDKVIKLWLIIKFWLVCKEPLNIKNIISFSRILIKANFAENWVAPINAYQTLTDKFMAIYHHYILQKVPRASQQNI